ncbi:potassium-transporting ATPase subunit KdpC [Aureibacillus halotolerans]|uniref:Potassium-transporting ATPase KdpC subunit n=1 Tax=Aureibacillus halotolerans TaxID=1508390 RepID=A0A4R6U473_9BACI|nr:potassium-transporting ATPase subunit KdpC [Aureibacillus halotolerans]TDQ40496.1 K+-transporting ATPase ATPase C chain [Aureibacillus halotolerans]
MKTIGVSLWSALRFSLVGMIICGLLYPLGMTAIGQGLFHKKAEGQLIYNEEGNVIGSALIGQQFTEPGYFHGRPSSIEYNAGSSGSPNFAPSNPALVERINASIEQWEQENPNVPIEDVPQELLTNSASGLDPHISEASALVQVPRVSEATGLSEETLQELITANTQGPSLGLFGEAGVNVLELNIDIKALVEDSQ